METKFVVGETVFFPVKILTINPETGKLTVGVGSTKFKVDPDEVRKENEIHRPSISNPIHH